VRYIGSVVALREEEDTVESADVELDSAMG